MTLFVMALFLNTAMAESYYDPNAYRYQYPNPYRESAADRDLRRMQQEYDRAQRFNNSAYQARRGWLQNCHMIGGNPAAQRYCYQGAP